MVDFIETDGQQQNRKLFKQNKAKGSKSEIMHKHIKEMKTTVKNLKVSITESEFDDQHLLKQMCVDQAKSQRINKQLEEARKENKQFLNILQQSCYEKALSRDLSRSQVDISSAYSTMSIVNLQYKYEELVSNYEGLLKMLATKDKDIQKCYKENESIRDEMNNISTKFQECDCSLRNVCAKYLALKQRKDIKIKELRNEKETLRLAHNKVVTLLHEQCMENEALLEEKLHNTVKPKRALFIQEIQRSNKLQHENMLLKQEIACLKARCPFKNVRFSLKDSKKEKQKIENTPLRP